MILVTGAAGKSGLAVVRALKQRGEPIRALVHSSDQIDKLYDAGAVEVEIGDLLESASLVPIFAGMRAVYHICPNVHPLERVIGFNAIAASEAAGIPHFVMHSVLHPQTQAMPHHWNKLRVEERLIDSGLGFTMLQPATYMQNVDSVWSSVVEHGEYRVPYSVEARFSPVDLRDVAELAAMVLSTPGHEGALYELAGPDLLSSQQMAVSMGEELGRPVEAIRIDLEKWEQGVEIDPERVAILRAMFEYYSEHGFRGNPRVLAGLLGREPASFKRYLRRHIGESLKQ